MLELAVATVEAQRRKQGHVDKELVLPATPKHEGTSAGSLGSGTAPAPAANGIPSLTSVE